MRRVPPWAEQRGGAPWARRGRPPGTRRGRRPPWARRDPDRFDPGPAVASGVIQVVGCSFAEARIPGLGYLLLLAGPVALLVNARRRNRLAVPALIAAVAATVLYESHGFPGGPTFIAALFALVNAVRHGHRWPARIVVGLGYLAYVANGRLTGTMSWTHAAVVGAWTVVAYGLAEAARVQAGQLAALARAHAEEERAAAERERATEEAERRQIVEERLRIARELHDALGHHLSLINVQAGVGLHLLDEHPEQARAALAAIRQASSEALGEVRGVLAALRPQGEAPPRKPAPGLAGVEDLVATAGFPVTLTTEGTATALPPDVDRAAYRIVQEALTNVRRHAGPAPTADLTLAYGADRLGVRVVNPLPAGAPSESTGGSGITGMRERATALGGTLRAGPRPEGGFEVVADLPVRGDGP